MQVKTAVWNGKGSLIGFVLGQNAKRRDLTSSQRAVIALEAEPWFAEEARKRQITLAGTRPNSKPKGDLPEMFPEGQDEPKTAHTHTATSKHGTSKKKRDKNGGEAREQVARAVGTNAHYVSDAKTLGVEHPELLADIKAGKVSLNEAKKRVKQEKKAADRAAEVAAMQLEENRATGLPKA